MKRSRTRRVLAIGALLGTVMSVGAMTDSASADEADTEASSVLVRVDSKWGARSMSSGVRW